MGVVTDLVVPLLVSLIGGGTIGALMGRWTAREQLRLERTKHKDQLDAPKRQHKLESLQQAETALKDAIEMLTELRQAPNKLRITGMHAKVGEIVGAVAAQVGTVRSYSSNPGPYMAASNELTDWARSIGPGGTAYDTSLLTMTMQDAAIDVAQAIQDL